MAVCPWVVDTALVRAGLANIGPEERKRKEGSWVHKLMQPSEVARAASLLLAQGKPGDVVTAGPDNTVYLYPFSLQRVVFILCKIIHLLLSSSGLVSPNTLLSDRTIQLTFVLLVSSVFLALHLLLSWLGL